MGSISNLADAQTHLNKIALKRVRFVLKILKVLVHQAPPRQCHVYISEAMDSLGEWNGNLTDNFTRIIDKELFPTICRLVSTFTPEEFQNFQQIICKLIFSKWIEKYLVLDFMADVYGFIARIAPDSVAVELIQIFQQEEIPAQAKLIILPALMKNVSDTVANDSTDDLLKNFLRYQKENVSTSPPEEVLQFWINLKETARRAETVHQLAPILNHCIITSTYLEELSNEDTFKIHQSLTEWSYDSISAIDSEGFLLISTIFLLSFCSSFLKKEQHSTFVSITMLLKSIVAHIENCSNRRIRVFSTKVLQRILEYADENGVELEILSEFVHSNQINEDDSASGSTKNKKKMLFEALEMSLKLSSELDCKMSEDERKRILPLIDSLQKLVESRD